MDKLNNNSLDDIKKEIKNTNEYINNINDRMKNETNGKFNDWKALHDF